MTFAFPPEFELLSFLLIDGYCYRLLTVVSPNSKYIKVKDLVEVFYEFMGGMQISLGFVHLYSHFLY